MEICGSIAEARRYNSSASGWSAASDRTRAITRRWSVILRPLSTQAFSIRVTESSLILTVPAFADTPDYAGSRNRLGEFDGQRKPEQQRILDAIIAFTRPG